MTCKNRFSFEIWAMIACDKRVCYLISGKKNTSWTSDGSSQTITVKN